MENRTEKQGDSAATIEYLQIELDRLRRELEDCRRAAAGLAEENENLREDFRDLFEEAPIAYVHEGLDSRFIRANRAAMNLLGIKSEDVVGKFGKEFVPNIPDAQ